MRRIVFKIAVLFALTMSTIACGQNKNIPESLLGIKERVAQLDSAVNAMYGWEPRDSTYDASIYKESRVTWAEFKRLCDQEKYEESLEYYLADKPNGGGSNLGDFLVFLQHSTYRFFFFSQVLLPLMSEYKGAEFARKKYIDLLQLEKAMEDTTIDLQADGNGYVPEVYPHLIHDLGLALTADGKLDEALDLADDLMKIVNQISGEVLYANFIGTQYAALLYIYLDDKENAVGTWEDFKQFLVDTKDDYDPETLAELQTRIQKEIDSIQQ